MNIQQFNRQIQDVIDWNAVARNMTHTFTEVDLASQTDYVHEEVMETIAALATKDDIETLDGAADVFVTLAYKYFLMRQQFDADYRLAEDLTEQDDMTTPRLKQDYLLAVACNLATNNLYGASVDDIEFTVDLLYFFMNTIEKWYGVDMHKVVDAVMASNWSKFPIYDEKIDYQAICHEIEFERNQTNVAFSKVEVNGVVRVSFRNNFGQGKIMKPPTFVTPALVRLMNEQQAA